MTTSGQICKMSYTAYSNTYCDMGQLYCNILQYAFCRIFSPLQTNIFTQCGIIRMSESHQKRKEKKQKTKEEKEEGGAKFYPRDTIWAILVEKQ